MGVHAAPSQNSTRDGTLGGSIVQSGVTSETPGVRRRQHGGRPGDIGGTRGQHMANASRLAETSNGNIREQQHPNQQVRDKPMRDDQVLRRRNKIVLVH